MNESVDFRVTITGRADPEFLAGLVEDAKRMTPVGGGFTFEVGDHATADDF